MVPGASCAAGDRVAFFCGPANRGLGTAVAQLLGQSVGAATFERFPDGEVRIEIGERVRRAEVVVVQSTAPPVNDRLMELLAFADASRRAGADTVTAVIPYFGYARSDRRQGRREPIGARLVANLIEAAGIDRVITLDLHACQIEGFFDIPVESRSAVPALCESLRARLAPGTVVVSPDAGRLQMASEYARRLDASLIVLHKTRDSATRTHVTHLVGDVRDRPCLVVDDMISTGGTIAGGARVLLDAGARPGITVAATHGLLLDGARLRMTEAGVSEVFVSDTIERPTQGWPGMHVVSVAPIVAAAIEQPQRVGRDRAPA